MSFRSLKYDEAMNMIKRAANEALSRPDVRYEYILKDMIENPKNYVGIMSIAVQQVEYDLIRARKMKPGKNIYDNDFYKRLGAYILDVITNIRY